MSDNKPWVKDSGHATESELAARVQKYPIDGCWAAFYTDRFAAGRTADGVPLSTPENLLELRVFGEAGELWLCRSQRRALHPARGQGRRAASARIS